ncbi:hypothetical protein QYM36_013833 [Artemia franciscana]|uniref:Uncharacterized protein n=1 Tax=Artemia franciscana TaxID=6661 RepID=A0AA88HJQ0_ARTSF|nr:hypothetical protein QYM36_013833 [Artemia franciscana]
MEAEYGDVMYYCEFEILADLDNDEIIDESAKVSSVPSVTIVQSSEQVVVKPFIQKRPQPFTRLQRPSLPRRINDSPLRQRQHQPTPDPLLSESDSDYYDESDDEVVDNFKENKLEKVKIGNGRASMDENGLGAPSWWLEGENQAEAEEDDVEDGEEESDE